MGMLDIVKGLPKPVPFLTALETLVRAGYNRTIAADQITINALNSHDSQGTLKDKQLRNPSGYKLMDGMLFPSSGIGQYEDKGIFYTKKKTLNGKYLILLPCNAGAFVGDYFTKNTWRSAARYFPERMSCLDFAATDSITTITSDPLGLIVFENEMNRVQGYDLFPSYSKEKLLKCEASMRASVPRLRDYDLVFSFLNVRLYDEAVQSALLSNLVRVPVAYKQGFFLQGLPDLRRSFELHADAKDLIFKGE